MLDLLIGRRPGCTDAECTGDVRSERGAAVIVDEFILPMFGEMRASPRASPPGASGRPSSAASTSVVGQALFYRLHHARPLRLLGVLRIRAGSRGELAEHITAFSRGASSGWRGAACAVGGRGAGYSGRVGNAGRSMLWGAASRVLPWFAPDFAPGGTPHPATWPAALARAAGAGGARSVCAPGVGWRRRRRGLTRVEGDAGGRRRGGRRRVARLAASPSPRPCRAGPLTAHGRPLALAARGTAASPRRGADRRSHARACGDARALLPATRLGPLHLYTDPQTTRCGPSPRAPPAGTTPPAVIVRRPSSVVNGTLRLRST